MPREVAGISVLALAAWLFACGSETKPPATEDAKGCDAGAQCADAGRTPPTPAADAGKHEDAGDVSTSVDPDAGVVTASIGREGGSVSLPNGASVKLPAGALDTKTSLVIRVVDDLPALPSGHELRGRAYAFEPHGKRFDVPVTLRLPFEGDARGLTALRLDDEQDTSWETVSGGKAGSDHVLELRVSHFSIYAVAGTTETPDAAVVASCDVENGGCGDPSYVECVEESGAAPSCADIDECQADNGGCDSLAACENLFGAPPTCGSCPSGYSGSGDSGCIDVDECAAGAIAACGDGATECMNLTGDYACTCDVQHLGTGHQCLLATYCAPLTPLASETCYDFQAHAVSSPSDTTKFAVATGEAIAAFYFDVPWAAGTVASRTEFSADAVTVVADAWLYDSGSSTPGGTVSSNVVGTVLGENAALLDHWGPGGCDLALPDDVGLHLPDPGRRVMLSVHYYNATGAAQQDGSAFRVCTVAGGSRAHVAGLTLLGTENLGGASGILPGTNTFSGSCINNSGVPITLVSLTPYAHLIGTHVKATVSPTAGGSVVVLDQPYDFNHQVRYDAFGSVMSAGDQITTSCTFNNSTSSNVAYGFSTQQEMCHVFALAYPYGALDNGVPSLLGATNTCW